MKFINKSKKSIEVRTGEKFHFSWLSVKPGETIDLPAKKGKRYGFKKVTDQVTPQDQGEDKTKSLKVTGGKIGKTKVETKQFEKDFKTELEKINGIGKKTAEDIVKVFPTEKKLRYAISHDDELPFRNDVEKKLRKDYGK